MTAQPVTRGPAYHFFGYYDKCPWDVSGRYLLAQETTFMDRRPSGDDEAVIGLIDRQDDDRFLPVAATRAWNWQQGCMLQWLPTGEIIYNDRDGGDRFVSVVLDPHSGARRVLSRPIYAVRPDGQSAVSLNFSRLHDVRPGYGYAGIPDPWRDDLCPDDDGIYHLNLATGESHLVLSLAQVAALGSPDDTMSGGKHRFNHLQFSPDGSRFVFLHRWGIPGGVGGGAWRTRMFTANADGSDPFCVSEHRMISHFDWRDSTHLLAWARRDNIGNRYFLFRDRSDEVSIVGEGVLTVDGHCSYSPDRRWLLTDTYPDAEGYCTLILFDPATERRVDVGRFYGPRPADVEIRCDLHPRWSRDGKQVCIDSTHEGTRQVYVLDLEDAYAAHGV